MRLVDKLLLVHMAIVWLTTIVSTYLAPWYVSLFFLCLAVYVTGIMVSYISQLNRDRSNN